MSKSKSKSKFNLLEHNGFIIYDKLTSTERFYGNREAATSDGIYLQMIYDRKHSKYVSDEGPDSDSITAGDFLIFTFRTKESKYIKDMDEFITNEDFCISYQNFRKIVHFMKVDDSDDTEMLNLYLYSLSELVQYLNSRAVEGTIELIFNNQLFNSMNKIDYLCSCYGCGYNNRYSYSIMMKNQSKNRNTYNHNYNYSCLYIPVIDNNMLMNDEGIICFQNLQDELQFVNDMLTTTDCLNLDGHGLEYYVMLFQRIQYDNIDTSKVILEVPESGSNNTVLKNLNELETLLPKQITPPKPDNNITLVEVVNLELTSESEYDITQMLIDNTNIKYNSDVYIKFIETLNS